MGRAEKNRTIWADDSGLAPLVRDARSCSLGQFSGSLAWCFSFVPFDGLSKLFTRFPLLLDLFL